jgi:catalase
VSGARLSSRTDGNLGRTLSYWPNSKGLWIDRDPALAEPPLPLRGAAAHCDHRVDEDHFEQPGNLFRKRSPAQKRALFENTARAFGDAREEVSSSTSMTARGPLSTMERESRKR